MGLSELAEHYTQYTIKNEFYCIFDFTLIKKNPHSTPSLPHGPMRKKLSWTRGPDARWEFISYLKLCLCYFNPSASRGNAAAREQRWAERVKREADLIWTPAPLPMPLQDCSLKHCQAEGGSLLYKNVKSYYIELDIWLLRWNCSYNWEASKALGLTWIQTGAWKKSYHREDLKEQWQIE